MAHGFSVTVEAVSAGLSGGVAAGAKFGLCHVERHTSGLGMRDSN